MSGLPTCISSDTPIQTEIMYLGPQTMIQTAWAPPAVSTSGEFCITALNNPHLGNMSDSELVQGFGPDMPILDYGLTAITHYTKRENPDDMNDPNRTEGYGYLRVMTPNPKEPEGDLLWDTGWRPITPPTESTN